MSLYNEIRTLMNDYSFTPSEENSENFVVDENILNKEISSAELSSNDIVLEIGSGFGFLIDRIIKICPVIAVENDTKLFSYLTNKYELNQKVTLINADFLEMIPPSFTKIISNPPYGIVDRIMYKLIHYDFLSGVMILPKTLSDTLLDGKSTRLSFILKQFFSFEKIMDVQKEAFFPVPRVTSEMMKFTRLKESMMNRVLLYENSLVKNAILIAYQDLNRKTKRESREALASIAKDDDLNRILTRTVKSLNLNELQLLYDRLKIF